MEPLFFETPAALRAWLRKNHAKAAELWVGFWKRETGRSSITWPELVDGVLCYGWIDGVRKSIDASSYKIRITPRKPGSTWSQVNTKRMAELQKAGLVTAAGRRAFEARDPEKTKLYSYEARRQPLAAPYLERLEADPTAAAYWAAQPPGYRRLVSFWVMSAKQEATRERRLQTLIDCCARGERLPGLEKRKPDQAAP